MNYLTSLRNRLVLLFSLLLFFVLIIFCSLALNLIQDSMDTLREQSTVIMKQSLSRQWENKTQALAQTISSRFQEPLYLLNVQEIGQNAAKLVSEGIVRTILVLDASGRILFNHSSLSRNIGTSLPLPSSGTKEGHGLSGKDIYEVSVPVSIGDKNLGWIIMGFDISQVIATLSQVREKHQVILSSAQNTIINKTAFIALMSLCLGILLSSFLAGNISNPIRTMAKTLSSVRADTLDIRFPYNHRIDEIGLLSRSLENLAEKLQKTTLSRNAFQQIILSMDEGIAFTDLQGKVWGGNHAFREITGTDIEENRDCKIWTFLPLDMPSIQKLKGAVIQRKNLPRTEAIVNSPFGIRKTVSLGAFIIHGNQAGQPKGYVLVLQDISNRKEMEERLERSANFDALTGLPNRKMVLSRLGKMLQAYQEDPKQASSFSLIFIDLDRFKTINDSLGHNLGDELLEIIGGRISAAIPPEAFIGHPGGDEYIILLPTPPGAPGAEDVTETLLKEIARPIDVQGHSLQLTASIGIAPSWTRFSRTSEMVAAADMAMYAAKNQGKNRYVTFTHELMKRNESKFLLERELKQAIGTPGIGLFYQPVYNSPGNELYGFEALVRWHHPERGLLSPAAFIPIAEETGLIVPLTRQVLSVALEQHALLREHSGGNLTTHVNISAKHFEDGDLLKDVHEALRASRIPPNELVLEFTETALAASPEKAAFTMSRLKELGVRLAIDDFGTGYSSLAYLHRFPLDILKVDRTFITGARTDEKKTKILRTILNIGSTLDLTVVAEGIETNEDHEYLLHLGFTNFQGFLFAPPLPIREARALLDATRTTSKN